MDAFGIKKKILFAVFFTILCPIFGTASCPASEESTVSNETLANLIEDLRKEIRSQRETLERQDETIQALRSKVEALEGARKQEAISAESAAVQPEPASAVLEKLGTKLKIKGRAGVGFFKSGSGASGAYPQGSFEIPEAKLQFSLDTDEYNTFVFRMNLNNAAFNNVDYLYLDSKNFLTCLEGTPFTLESRLGRFKLPFGEETLSNNIVESALGSNSAANPADTDEGWQLSGKVGRTNPWKWFLAFSNGNSGTGSDNLNVKSVLGKLAYSPVKPLNLSAGVYHSGALKTAASEFSFAGSTARPAGAAKWSRTLWELDARWDFGKGKIVDPPAYTDSRAYLRGAWGGIDDNADSAVQDRQAGYGFVEGLYNFHPKWYAAARYSLIDMHGNDTATLNSVSDATSYDRYSVALGYRWSPSTLLKLAYDWNVSDTLSGDDPSDNLLTAAAVSSF
ncbi:MAG: hypothetical protein HYT89_07490 [Candidatus Omnitrophica bacterium]|nr:hypothetical protein [Candidatus Omnitrophota bacterium]